MSEPILSFRDLGVWQKGMDLVVECYRVSEGFPKSESYGLTSQLRRAAVSIPANVAEGKGRRTTRSYLHFVDIAYGSLMELETLLEIASRLSYLPAEARQSLMSRAAEIGRMLNGLIASLERKLPAEEPGS
jgi:four helix bundle protein